MLCGCSSLIMVPDVAEPQSFLRPVETGPDSVALEIFQVRFPANDAEFIAELWGAVDEMRLDVALRHELLRNGFRAGVLGAAVPDGLAQRLNLQSEAAPVEPERVITGTNADPQVTRRVVQLNRHDTAKIQAAKLRPSLHVFLSDATGVHGRSYQQAEAAYNFRAAAVTGQQVQLELAPELQHGEMRNRYAGGDQGIFLMTQSRERESFDRLAMRTQLAAGEIFVVGCLPDVSGSLGYAFHTEDFRGPSELKLVLVRLLQVPHSEILAQVGGE